MCRLLYFSQLLCTIFVCSIGRGIHNRILRITNSEFRTENINVPYFVRIDYDGKFGKHFLCSGTLVRADFVLTAAHCVTNLPNDIMTVSSILEYSKPRRIVNIFTLNEYGVNSKEYYITVLKVYPPFSTENSYIQPIGLSDYHMESGDKLQVSDYRRRLANSFYISSRQCNKFFNGKVNITRNMFCGIPETPSSVCSHDAGGPIVRNGKLCGVMLWSAGWIDAQSPEVYISIKSVRRFIEKILAPK